MVCRINVRRDQDASQAEKAYTKKVRVFAKKWVRKALVKLGRRLEGIKFEVWARENPGTTNRVVLETFFGGEDLTLRELQMIARNEPNNTTGIISTIYYEADLVDVELILSIKDLVRQTVIVGLDQTTGTGGFPRDQPKEPQIAPVYICDLAALQCQQRSNTGRLVLYQRSGRDIGFLDDYIFRKVVGEDRKRYKQVEQDKTGRYVCVPQPFTDEVLYFDTEAYMKFVAEDVLLCGLAVNKLALRRDHQIHFKFLQYGTGHFAGKTGLKSVLIKYILPGVVKGLRNLFKHKPMAIKSLEFPFYEQDDESIRKLEKLKLKYEIKYHFSRDDALKTTAPDPDSIIATTNCANPHSPIGNAMSFGSIDGAIANNLRTKGNIFCPCLNRRMRSRFMSLKVKS